MSGEQIRIGQDKILQVLGAKEMEIQVLRTQLQAALAQVAALTPKVHAEEKNSVNG